MQRTLFHINLELFGWPMFGVGWLLFAWIGFGACYLVWLLTQPNGKPRAISSLTTVALFAAVIYVAKFAVEVDANDKVLGLPVRGYGFMLLVAFASSVGLAAHRARRMGVRPDHIYQLAMWMILSGIVGARLFYVIQNWHLFQTSDLVATVAEIFKFTQGGLVVYGSFIGGVAGALVYMYRHRLPPLAMADLVAPSMVLGLALGRLGCLMNGCCWGGVCEAGPLAIQFPIGSPPYRDHLASGELLGLEIAADGDAQASRITDVKPGSLADKAGLSAKDSVARIDVTLPPMLSSSSIEGIENQEAVRVADRNQKIYSWKTDQLPSHSLPVHPTQIYSAVNAGLICLLLLAMYPFRNRDGLVFATGLTLYAITRMMLEAIRVDEPGRFGTMLTISQFVSLTMLAAVAILLVYVFQRPAGSALPMQPAKS